MSKHLIGVIIDGGIEIVIGIYLLLTYYRVVGKERGEDSKYDLFMEEKGDLLKFAGIGIIIFGAFRIFTRL